MRTVYALFFTVFVWIVSSCNSVHDQSDALRLERWDALCDSFPEAIADSLKTMNPSRLSSRNRVWHGLLTTITHDKTHSPFTSDSLINSVEEYYRKHGLESRDHIRSLIYQGIVRVRMGVTDSTVYEPLKEALTILQSKNNPDPNLLYFANFYMGHIHRENDNDDSAFHYFQQALMSAKQYNNKSHQFDTYLKLCWMRLSEREYDNARLYLDTLVTYAQTPEDKYYLLNAEAVYFDRMGDYLEALKKEKEKLQMSHHLKQKPEQYRIFYSLSDRYFNLNNLDSALFYAREAIAHIQDSTNRLNYLLYRKAADIAAKKNDFRLADNYRTQALKAYQASITERLDTQIRELEKRYDLSEAEYRALKATTQFRFILILSICGVLFTAGLILYISKQLTITRLQKEKFTEHIHCVEVEKQQAKAEYQLSRERAQNQQQLLSLYNSFLKLHAEQQEMMRQNINRIRSKDSKLGDIYAGLLKSGQLQLNRFIKELFTVEDMRRLFDIHDEANSLNESDRLYLFMLANKVDNEQIAALFNTTVKNLKGKKAYLKKKISSYATPTNRFQNLLELF